MKSIEREDPEAFQFLKGDYEEVEMLGNEGIRPLGALDKNKDEKEKTRLSRHREAINSVLSALESSGLSEDETKRVLKAICILTGTVVSSASGY